MISERSEATGEVTSGDSLFVSVGVVSWLANEPHGQYSAPRLAAGSASSIEENGGLVLSSEEASITLAAVGVDAPDSEGRNVAGNPFSMAIEVTPHNALIALSSCSTFTSRSCSELFCTYTDSSFPWVGVCSGVESVLVEVELESTEDIEIARELSAAGVYVAGAA